MNIMAQNMHKIELILNFSPLSASLLGAKNKKPRAGALCLAFLPSALFLILFLLFFRSFTRKFGALSASFA